MSLGIVSAMSGSWRQKLNTGSSTETELVGIDDALKHIMWGLYFIQSQVYEVTKKYSYAGQQVDHPDGQEWPIFMLQSH